MRSEFRVGVVLSTHPSIGGGSTYESAVLEVLRAIARPGLKFFPILKSNGEYEVGPDLLELPSKRFTRSVSSRDLLPRKRKNRGGLNSATTGLDIDLLYFVSPVQALSENRGVPFIATVWDLGITQLSHFPEFSGDYGKKMFSVLSQSLPRAFRVLVDSNATRSELTQTYRLNPEKVLSAGLPMSDSQDYEKPSLQTPGKYVVYPARLWPHKNHWTLLEAFKDVTSAIPDANLVLTGLTQEEIPQALRMVGSRGLEDSVTILSRVSSSELNWIIRSARALVMPTSLGPTNYPPLEALRVGTRAIISDVHKFDFELPESVITLPLLDVTAWARAIIQAFEVSSSPPPIKLDNSHFIETFENALEAFRSDWQLWKDLY